MSPKRKRWRTCFAAAMSVLLSGCTADHLLLAVAAPNELRIGYHSTPAIIPRVGDTSVELLPLNNNYYRNQTAFVVCFVGPGDSGENHHVISLDPARIALVRADGSRLRPQAYAEYGKCPRDGNFRPIDEVFEFKPVASGTTASSLRGFKSWVFTDIAFRFDVETIDPHDAFSVELNSIDIDGKSHSVPPITFAKVYGYGRPAPAPGQGADLIKVTELHQQRRRELDRLKSKYKFAGEPGKDVLKRMSDDGCECHPRSVPVLPGFYETTAEKRTPRPSSFFSCGRAGDASLCAAYEIRFHQDRQRTYSSVRQFESEFLGEPVTQQRTSFHCHEP